MKKAFIVYSTHTKEYAEKIAKNYDKVAFLQVKKPPTLEIMYNIVPEDYTVIGIGGGSVIDTAKVIARPKRCIVIPTTASGACATPYATIWGKKKESIKTAKPMLRFKTDIEIKLPNKVIISTLADALSHALESLWSKNATFISKYHSYKALWYLSKFLGNNNIYTLIKGGNFAGEAIARAKTNIIHAISYPLTIHYRINHGLACGLIFPYIFNYIKPNHVKISNVLYLTKKCIKYIDNINDIDSKLIAEEAMGYKKINDTIKPINKKYIINILENIKCLKK